MNKPLFPDVIVNDTKISAADIAAEAQNHAAPSGKPGLAWRAAARALVVRELLLQEGARLGLTPEPQDLGDNRFETPDEAMVRMVFDQAIEPDAPSQAEIDAAYEASQDRFRAPSLFEPAHILFAADPKNAEARKEAHTKARAALNTLLDAPDRFGQLATELSDCPSRSAGGRLGQISSGDTVPEFEAALAALEPGQLANSLIETRYGVHLVRLDAKAVGAVLPQSQVETKIIEALEKAAWTNAAWNFVNTLISRAEISGVDLTPTSASPPTGT